MEIETEGKIIKFERKKEKLTVIEMEKYLGEVADGEESREKYEETTLVRDFQ